MPQAKSFSEWFFEFIEDHEALCSGCGYSLSGIQELRCPECGGDVNIESTMGQGSPRGEHRVDDPVVGIWQWCLIVVLVYVVVMSAMLLLY